MRPRRQIVDPRQQPGNRHYNYDRERYYRDEESDFRRGADYIPDAGNMRSHDNTRAYDQRGIPQDQVGWRDYSENLYTPSHDYGYDNGRYSQRDHRREASGYGDEYSPQSSDFGNWLHQRRFRNQPHGDFARPERRFHTQGHGRNWHAEKGLYDYANERDGFSQDDDRELPHVDRWHNRTGRHLEIVVPFKDESDYGPNYYNESEGFGSNEMVYPGPRRGIRESWPYDF